MENLVKGKIKEMLEPYLKKKVFITGHNGFKGSWLCALLESIDCDVVGYSLAPPSTPAHFSELSLTTRSIHGDICDKEQLFCAFAEEEPEIVFHLAAQALVRPSYDTPLETLSANIMGTAHVLEASRRTESVRAVIIVTSDKCYENKEWDLSYRENDPMGGYDPYSASKGCAELVTASYRNSFFNLDDYGKTHKTLIASVRAGNVIGGGDWAADRLIPDIMKAASVGGSVIIRNPNAIRPWQHVLEPLTGYMELGGRLLQGQKECARAWNFGPPSQDTVSVGEVVTLAAKHWPDINWTLGKTGGPHEAGLLSLDVSLARHKLGWASVWGIEDALRHTVDWYRCFYEGTLNTFDDIDAYMHCLRKRV